MLKKVLKVVLISILLFSMVIVFRHPHEAFYDAKDEYVFSSGNAPDHVRSEIVKQLHKFQDGYTYRDITQVDPFMEQLFSQENIFVLGTMPNEIYIGQEEVSRLVYSDWNAWGDCIFSIDNAYISASRDAA